MEEKKTKITPGLVGLLGSIGGALTLHHKVEHGEWWDEKRRCHGKIGAAMLVSSLLVILGINLEGDKE